MNSRTDFSNTHDTGHRLQTETVVRINPHLRRAAERSAVKSAPKAPTVPAAVAAVNIRHATVAGRLFGRMAFNHEWNHGATPAGLELGRFKSAAMRAADRALVGVFIGRDGDLATLPVDVDDDTSATGSVRACVDRAFFLQKVRPGVGTRATFPVAAPRFTRRRAPFRLPAAVHGPACAAPVPAAG